MANRRNTPHNLLYVLMDGDRSNTCPMNYIFCVARSFNFPIIILILLKEFVTNISTAYINVDIVDIFFYGGGGLKCDILVFLAKFVNCPNTTKFYHVKKSLLECLKEIEKKIERQRAGE